MHETKLDDLLTQLIEKDNNDYDPSISRWYYLKHLHFYGDENQHLLASDDETERFNHRRSPRADDKLLTGDETVYGDILLHDSCGHDGTEVIQVVSSLDEAREQILNSGGILNSFTSEMNVFVNGKLKEYKIYLEDNKGNYLEFIKGVHDNLFYNLYEKGIYLNFEWI